MKRANWDHIELFITLATIILSVIFFLFMMTGIFE